MKKIIVSLFGLFLLSGISFAKYEFQINDRNIVYQEDELKFYENNELMKPSEVNKLFPDYELFLISDFDKNKQLKIKNKQFQAKKILLINDTNRTFHKFFVYPESSRNSIDKNDKDCKIKSLITIYGKKDTRLKHEGGDQFEIIVK